MAGLVVNVAAETDDWPIVRRRLDELKRVGHEDSQALRIAVELAIDLLRRGRPTAQAVGILL